MQLWKYALIAATLGLSFGSHANAQNVEVKDVLTKTVSDELKEQCLRNPAAYKSCVQALRFHGLGKDDAALKELTEYAQTPKVKHHYSDAAAWPKDKLWILVAKLEEPDSCDAIPELLPKHFDFGEDALSAAYKDSGTNPFIGLADLIDLPAGRNPGKWNDEYAKYYRACFMYENNFLFKAVKTTLGH